MQTRRSFLRSLVTGAAALAAGATVAKEAIFLPHTPKVIPPVEPVVKVPPISPKMSVTNANKFIADLERTMKAMDDSNKEPVVFYMNAETEKHFRGIKYRLYETLS